MNIFLATILEYLVTYNSSVTAVKIEVISDIKYQLQFLHLEEFFIQERQENNSQHLC